MQRKLTRMEVTKEVRRVLGRHQVDMGYCNYTATPYEILITGWLRRIDGTEFSHVNIEALIHDFIRKLGGIYVKGDCDNWSFSAEHITHLDEDSRLQYSGSDQESTQQTYTVKLKEEELPEEDGELLKKLKRLVG